MKKVLLTAMALLTIASTSVFGYYGANSDWIDFLVDANQLRFRVRQMGFVLGNDMIRGVVGVRDESETQFGAIFN
ncbi:cell surface protein, partial [Brachyspira pilosicoli]